MKANRILILLILSWSFFESNAQYFEEIGGAIGLRISEFSIHNKQSITESNIGYSSLYCFDINLKKKLKVNKLFFQTGINISREQIVYYPLIRINEIPSFQAQFNDSFNVYEYRMWNYQLGVPIKVSYKLYDGWMDYYPLLWMPAINIYGGLVNNFVINKAYSDVLLLENYGKSNTVEFYDKTINEQVSSYYLNTIGNYSLIGQLGVDFYAPLKKLDAGISLSYNKYLISPFTRLESDNPLSIDIKIFLIYKFEN